MTAIKPQPNDATFVRQLYERWCNAALRRLAQGIESGNRRDRAQTIGLPEVKWETRGSARPPYKLGAIAEGRPANSSIAPVRSALQ